MDADKKVLCCFRGGGRGHQRQTQHTGNRSLLSTYDTMMIEALADFFLDDNLVKIAIGAFVLVATAKFLYDGQHREEETEEEEEVVVEPPRPPATDEVVRRKEQREEEVLHLHQEEEERDFECTGGHKITMQTHTERLFREQRIVSLVLLARINPGSNSKFTVLSFNCSMLCVCSTAGLFEDLVSRSFCLYNHFLKSPNAFSSQADALRIAEGPDPPVEILGPHSKVVLVPLLELGQGAGHGQWQGLDVPDLLPLGLGGLLVGIDLVGLDLGVKRGPVVEVPGEDNACRNTRMPISILSLAETNAVPCFSLLILSVGLAGGDFQPGLITCPGTGGSGAGCCLDSIGGAEIGTSLAPLLRRVLIGGALLMGMRVAPLGTLLGAVVAMRTRLPPPVALNGVKMALN